MKKQYLATVYFDCNDADIVHGCQILSEEEAKLVNTYSNKKISFGSCDFGENEELVGNCISLQEITEEEAAVLKKLGLSYFGETFNPREFKYLKDDDQDEEEDEEEDDEEKGFYEKTEKGVKPYKNKNIDTFNYVFIKNIHNNGYLKERNKDSLRHVVIEIKGIRYESVSNQERATVFTHEEAIEMLERMMDYSRANYIIEAKN